MLVTLQAAFVPASESACDTSYFTSRYSWNHSDDHVNAASEFEDTSDDGTASNSSGCLSDKQDELVLFAERKLVYFVNIVFSNILLPKY